MANAVFVIGHSPAILTESLAAACARDQMIFEEIWLVSTRTGAAMLRQLLFDEGGWDAFVKEWPEFAGAKFSERHIRALDCDDIRSEADNRQLVEAVLGRVRELTSEGMPMLMASIAGGRKTMSYYMGFAMSLFGRPGDRLTHVLVPEAWERDRDFLVPPRHEAKRIDLVDIPFLRVRDYVDSAIARADVQALVQSAQTAIDMASLEPVVLNVLKRSASYLGREISFADREFTYLQFFAESKLDGCVHPERATCGECRDCFLSYEDIDARRNQLLKIRALFGGVDSPHYQRFVDSWPEGRRSACSNIHEPLRRVAQAVEASFGIDPRAERLKVRNVGSRGQPRYGLMADKSQLRIVQA